MAKNLISYDPVTGKPVVAVENAKDLQTLMFREGLGVWEMLSEEQRSLLGNVDIQGLLFENSMEAWSLLSATQRESFKNFVQERRLQAQKKREFKYALAFYNDLIMRIYYLEKAQS